MCKNNVLRQASNNTCVRDVPTLEQAASAAGERVPIIFVTLWFFSMAGMLEMKAATTVSHWPPLFTPLQTASGAAIEALQSNPPPQLQAEQRTNLPETQSPSAQVFSLGAQTHTQPQYLHCFPTRR